MCGPSTSPEVSHRPGVGDGLSVAGGRGAKSSIALPPSQQLRDSEKSFPKHALTKSRFGLEQRSADFL